MENLEKEIHAIGAKVDEMYIALIGSPLTKDGGIIKRVANLEGRMERHDVDLSEIKVRETTRKSYQKTLYILITAILSGGGVHFIEKLFTSK